jgi:hypothetical protein
MKKFLLKTAKIVGTTTDKAWSQVHTFSPTEDEKLLKRGHFLAVISLSDLAEGIEPAAAGKEMISRLHEEYYGHLEEKVIHQLAKALEQILAETKEEAKVEIEAAALVEGVIYFAIAGKGKILIQRKGKLAAILSGEERKVEVASGRVESDDLFLLGSQKFFSLLNEEVIKTALSTNSTSEAAELLMPVVHKQEEDGTTAATVLKLKAGVEEKEVLESEKEVSLEKKPKAVSKRLVKEAVSGKISRILRPITRTGQLFFLRAGRKLKRRAIYLSGEESRKQKSKRTLITVALILAVLLLVSVVLGARQKNRQQEGSGLEMILRQATIKKEEGEALIDLNPIRARQLLIEAKGLIEEIDPEETTQAIFDFQAELEQSLSSVMREHEVEPRSLFDLVIIKDDAWGNDLAVSGREMVVFDQNKKTIYGVGIDGKNSSILTGGEDLTGGQQVGAFLPKIYLLTDRGILQFDKETKRQSLVIETDENWREIVDLRAFGGNLYLLDKQGEIWKYPGLEGGFGSYRHWVKNEESDFSDAVGMSIDGSVWVLKSDGRIWKYTQGTRDAFVMSGLDKPLDNPAAIFTDDDQENLYLLDKGNSRVVVINKSGEYHSQYLWQGASEATALIASEEEKKILLLSGNKIYEIEIK